MRLFWLKERITTKDNFIKLVERKTIQQRAANSDGRHFLFLAYSSLSSSFISDHDLEDLEMQVVRYKPEGLDVLCRKSKFTRKELQIMYRGFKQVECICGIPQMSSFRRVANTHCKSFYIYCLLMSVQNILFIDSFTLALI